MSDERLKKNIKDSVKAGKDLIGRLRVRDFEWKHNQDQQKEIEALAERVAELEKA